MKLINFFKGAKGVAVGVVLVALSLLYNSQFTDAIEANIGLQIVGYLILGLGAALIILSALSSGKTETAQPTENAENAEVEQAPQAADEKESEEE